MTVNTETRKCFLSKEEKLKFENAIEGLQSFVFDTNADIDMAYDWVCEMAEMSSFVSDNWAWDTFYYAFEDTQD